MGILIANPILFWILIFMSVCTLYYSISRIPFDEQIQYIIGIPLLLGIVIAGLKFLKMQMKKRPLIFRLMMPLNAFFILIFVIYILLVKVGYIVPDMETFVPGYRDSAGLLIQIWVFANFFFLVATFMLNTVEKEKASAVISGYV